MRHFIPIVNQVERLLPLALSGCEPLWPHTTIIDNRDTPQELAVDLAGLVPDSVAIYSPPVPLTTAQSMNLMLTRATAVGASFFTWQHLDAVPLGDTAEQLPAIARSCFERGLRWGTIFTHYDAFAAYNVGALNHIGGWDWRRFPYYFLDDDLHRRLNAAGYEQIDTALPCDHEGSSTIKDPQRAVINGAMFEASRQLYRQKHGCEPGKKIDARWWSEISTPLEKV